MIVRALAPAAAVPASRASSSPERWVKRGGRRLVAALVLLLAWWLPLRAHALLLPEYDLASLVWESNAVVRARWQSARKLDEWTTLVSYRVEKAYAGELKVGDVIEALDDYAREPADEWPRRKPHVVSDEVIAFLVRPRDRSRAWQWECVESGLRIALDGRVQRFHQDSNPGGYGPVPQGPDPWDLLGDPRGDVPLDWQGFESELAGAMARVERVRAALRGDLRSEAGTRALLETLGPLPEDEAPSWSGEPGFYVDLVASEAVKALEATGDLTATLEAVARARAGRWHDMGLSSISSGDLARAAGSSKVRVALRRAALSVLDQRRMSIDEGTRNSLVPLLSDPEVEVRKAALRLYFPPENKRYRAALEKRMKAETDPGAKRLLVDVARRAGLLDAATKAGDWLLFHAERDRHVVEATLLFAGGPRPSFRRIEIEARAEGGASGRMALGREQVEGSSSVHEISVQIALAFDPPLPVGTYALDLTAILDVDGRSSTRRVALSPLKVSTPLLPPGAATAMAEAMKSAALAASAASAAAAASSAAATMSAGSGLPAAPSAAPPSACGCRAAGDSPVAGSRGWIAAALAAAGWIAARRRRAAFSLHAPGGSAIRSRIAIPPHFSWGSSHANAIVSPRVAGRPRDLRFEPGLRQRAPEPSGLGRWRFHVEQLGGRQHRFIDGVQRRRRHRSGRLEHGWYGNRWLGHGWDRHRWRGWDRHGRDRHGWVGRLRHGRVGHGWVGRRQPRSADHPLRGLRRR
jgi:hypothetical protein